MADLTPQDIAEILRIFAESDLEELRLEVGGTRLHVSKSGNGLSPLPATDPADSPRADSPAVGASAPPSAAAPEPPSATPAPSAEGLHDLRSPLLGVFYRRPSPDQPAFVEVGSTVGPDDPVCIIDVMKMFTRVPAATAGRIAEILVEDGQLVEHGQVLMRLEVP